MLFTAKGSKGKGNALKSPTKRKPKIAQKLATKKLSREKIPTTIQSSKSRRKKSERNKKAKTKSLSKGKANATNKNGSHLTKNPVSPKKSAPPKRRTKKKDELFTDTSTNVFIQFSRVFQRHVVYRCKNGDESNVEVVQSFDFLDDATKIYPNAPVLAPKDLPFSPPSCTVDYLSDEEHDKVDKEAVEEKLCESTIAGMGLWDLCELEYPENHDKSRVYGTEQAHEALRTLLQLVSPPSSIGSTYMVPRHFFRLDPDRFALRGHTSESITNNYARVVKLLSCGRDSAFFDGDRRSQVGLAMDQSDILFVMSNFPQLCLYDGDELETLIRFLLAPPPMEKLRSWSHDNNARDRNPLAEIDWARVAWEGYGVGLTVTQATKTIRMLPEFLSLYYEDARKPSIVYLYNQIQAPMLSKLCDEANIELNQFLEGTDPSDAYAFAYLRSIGISWQQIRTLISALPLWVTNNLEPGWELLQHGPVRNMLKRPSLDYLRQRLQVSPSEIYHMLRTHSRLSSYDACAKVRPTLDALQIFLGLSSEELRKVVLRMPSLIGMSDSSLENKIDFFLNEAGLSIQDLKDSVLKQPSLLQYGIDSSLRPKIHFFLEISVPREFLRRIIHSSPAIMGLSLPGNLRPKVKTLMTMCSLSLGEVGSIVATSPQILLLSQKNIETKLKHLSGELQLTKSRELGEMVISAPRILLQSLDSSLSKKINLLTNALSSKQLSASVLMSNPRLLALTTTVFDDRIRRCINADGDIMEGLLPSVRGRRKLVNHSITSSNENPIFTSSDNTFTSISGIFSNPNSAALALAIPESDIVNACSTNLPINGMYFCSTERTDLPTNESSYPLTEQSPVPGKTMNHSISISIFASGCVYPSDNFNSSRGRSRNGGLALHISIDRRNPNAKVIQEQFAVAMQSSFGIRVPLGNDDDGSKLLAVFPFLNPSRNRCELFSCYGALKVVEAFAMNLRRDEMSKFNIKIYTDSNYSWKLVKDKEHLIRLGQYSSSQEMLEHLDLAKSVVNIDIFHPLARTFCRLNGVMIEKSSLQGFDNVCIEFRHSTDHVLEVGTQSFVKSLNQQAKYAAMWQYNRERNVSRRQ